MKICEGYSERMRKRNVAIFLTVVIALISAACSMGSPKENTPVEDTGENLITEGEDTLCEVKYKP